MTIFITKELRVSKLKHVRIMLVHVIDILIMHVNYLTILLKHKLGALDTAFLVKVWENENFIETEVSSGLECI